MFQIIDETKPISFCMGPDCDFARRQASLATKEVIEFLQDKFEVLQTSPLKKNKEDSFIEERLRLLKVIEDIFVKQACEDF